MRVVIDSRAQPRPGLYQRHLQARFRKDISGNPATGAATDNADVVNHVAYSIQCSLHMSESSRRKFLSGTLFMGSAEAALAFGVKHKEVAAEDWPTAVGSPAGTRYSALSQINRKNVDGLEVAWTYHTGERLPGKPGMECTPVVIDGVMYVTSWPRG